MGLGPSVHFAISNFCLKKVFKLQCRGNRVEVVGACSSLVETEKKLELELLIQAAGDGGDNGRRLGTHYLASLVEQVSNLGFNGNSRFQRGLKTLQMAENCITSGGHAERFSESRKRFVRSRGPAVIPAVQKAVNIAREKGAFVVWVLREHDATGRDVEHIRKHLYDGKTGPTIKGTDGASLVDGLTTQEGEFILVKSRFSAFFATNLDLVLRRVGIDHIVVAGVQTPNCIRATAFDAIAHDYPSVTVLSDASGAANEKIHSANLLDLQNVSVSTPSVAEWAAS